MKFTFLAPKTRRRQTPTMILATSGALYKKESCAEEEEVETKGRCSRSSGVLIIAGALQLLLLSRYFNRGDTCSRI